MYALRLLCIFEVVGGAIIQGVWKILLVADGFVDKLYKIFVHINLFNRFFYENNTYLMQKVELAMFSEHPVIVVETSCAAHLLNM